MQMCIWTWLEYVCNVLVMLSSIHVYVPSRIKAWCLASLSLHSLGLQPCSNLQGTSPFSICPITLHNIHVLHPCLIEGLRRRYKDHNIPHLRLKRGLVMANGVGLTPWSSIGPLLQPICSMTLGWPSWQACCWLGLDLEEPVDTPIEEANCQKLLYSCWVALNTSTP